MGDDKYTLRVEDNPDGEDVTERKRVARRQALYTTKEQGEGTDHGAGLGSAEPSAAEGTETILLVEDEEGVRRLVSTILASCGYTLLEATNGAEGLRLAGEYAGEIHLLVTDVIMPETSGLEIAKQLAGARPGMRVLFMSGYADDVLSPHGTFRVGVSFLEKPFTPDALARKVREALDALD